MAQSKCECRTHVRFDFKSDMPEVSEASLPTEPEFIGANLCRQCSVVRFNDGDPTYHGYRAESENGESIIKFDGDDKERELLLNYGRADTLPDLPILQGSAKAGCGFCCLLVDAIQGLQIQSAGAIKIDLHYMWRPENETPPNRYGLKMLIARLFIHSEKYEPEGSRWSFVRDCGCKEETGCCCLSTTLVFMVESGLGNCASWLRIRGKTVGKTLCDENVRMMKAELSRCDRECDHFEETNFRPTRLLDLEADSTADSIKLIESSTLLLEKPLRYAALSYCWGSQADAAAALRTTRGTLKEQLEHVSLKDVPSTIQDAITVARSLSIRYLWVDALCIIQGDLRDWETESELMGLVFRNAYVTFCASASASCREGFLRRPTSVEIGFRSSVNPEVQGSYHLRLHRAARGVSNRGASSLSLDLFFQEWGHRAWTLQEARLSRRMLLFGVSRVYFACPARAIMEKSFNNYHELSLNELFFAETSRQISQDGGKLVKDEYYNLWLDLVQDYAYRELTNPQDKLPAISGMAKILADSIGDAYFAGLWEGDLLRGLLWNVVAPRYRRLQALLVRLKLTRPMTGTYVAPSWSWASRDTVVIYRSLQSGCVRDYQSECSSVSATTIQERSSQNIYGRIENGQLSITGKVALPTSGLMGMDMSQPNGDVWRLRFANKGVAIVDLDWQASHDKDNLEKLELLLIASRLASSFDEDQSVRLDSGEVGDSETDHYTISSEQQRQSTGGVTRDLSRPSLGHEVMGASDCPSVEHDGDAHKRRNEKRYKDDSKVREAFGLVIHLAEEDTNYFRVGTFRCKVQDGGLAAFDDCPVGSVTII